MKVRVAVAGTIGKTIVLDTDAGATLGKNLRGPDGSVLTLVELRALLGGSGTAANASSHHTLTGLQEGDDHPQYTMWQADEYIKGRWTFEKQPIIVGTVDRLLDEFIEDTIGAALQDTTSINFHYADYGDSEQGQISATISDEYVEDLIAGFLADSDSVAFLYTDAGDSLKAIVLPGGVDHNMLLNYVADEHVAHSGVDLAAGAGLTGGGDITASRSFAVGEGTGITVNADDVSLSTATLASLALADTAVQPGELALSAFTGDHGDLTGLSDDDHTQYLLRSILTTPGDLMVQGASAAERLGVGTDAYVLTMVAGAPAWAPGGGGGGGGTVDSVVDGTGILVDPTDPANPIVSLDEEFVEDLIGSEFRNTTSIKLHYADYGALSDGKISATIVDEYVEDLIDRFFHDSASVDFVYTDVGDALIANVLPGGVDHDSLLNYVANKHIDHTAVTLTAGAGLTGGGDISASRSFAVGAGTGITVNADDVALSAAAIASLGLADTAVQPARALTAGAGLTGGGTLAADRTFDVGAGTGIAVNANDVALSAGSIASLGLADTAVQPARALTAGAGLTGGGTLAADRTFDVGAGTGIAVNANDVALSAATITSLGLADGSVQKTTLTTNGDLFVRLAGVVSRLGVGSNGDVLTVASGLPAWVAGAGTAVGANPSASVGLIAVNGSALTFLRSDGAPALDVGIVPTWTGVHTWSSAEPRLLFNESDQAANLKLWDFDVQGAKFFGRTRTDADGGGHNWLEVVRGATTAISSMSFGNAVDNNTFNFLGTGSTLFTGKIILPSGTAAAPSFTFSAANTSGLYLTGTSQIGFSIAGTMMATFDATTAAFANNASVGALFTAGDGAFTLSLSAPAPGGTSAIVIASATQPNFFMYEGDAALDEKIWRLVASAGDFFIQSYNDAQSTSSQALRLVRVGNAVTDFQFGNTTDNPTYKLLGTGAMTVGGALTVTGAVTATGALSCNSTAGLTLSATVGIITIDETDGAADERLYRIVTSGGTFNLQMRNDANNAGTTPLQINRTGTNSDATIITSDDLSLVGPTRFNSSIRGTGVVSPAAISADQNDYAGITATVSIARLITGAVTTQRNITGITGGVTGRHVYIMNIGVAATNGTIGLTGESASSTAGNRISKTVLITVGGGCMLVYDGTSSRWRPMSL